MRNSTVTTVHTLAEAIVLAQTPGRKPNDAPDPARVEIVIQRLVGLSGGYAAYRQLTADTYAYLERKYFEAWPAADAPTEPQPLQHPGTWLPGDKFVDWEGDEWVRDESVWHTETTGSLWSDVLVDSIIGNDDEAHISHLVERTVTLRGKIHTVDEDHVWVVTASGQSHFVKTADIVGEPLTQG